MTGRAAGYCAGFAVPGYAGGQGYGRGIGWGRGGAGRGWRNQFRATGALGSMRFGAPVSAYPPLEHAAERRSLRAQAEALKSELSLIDKRLAAFEEDAGSA